MGAEPSRGGALRSRLAAGVWHEITHLEVSPASCALGALLAFMLATKWLVAVPMVLQMLIYTVPILAAGSFFALNHHVEQLENPRQAPDAAVEVMTSKDALLFPLLASATLAAIYYAFKHLPARLVNVVLSVHMCVVGCYAIGATVASVWRVLCPGTRPAEAVKVLSVPWWARWAARGEAAVAVELSVARVIGAGVGVGVAITWLATKAWLFHNLFAICLSVHAIRIISVGTFRTATILLVGLFFYDVFWVFETDVMVTVAKSFDAPVKLVFPTAAGTAGLLGLGDVVIPGVFVAMTLRFDFRRHLDALVPVAAAAAAEQPCSLLPMHRPFSKFYFKTSMVAYAASLALTGAIMLLWHTAQPALLYLVPALLGSVYASALIRGELAALLAYSEEPKKSEEEEEEDEEEEEEEVEVNNDCAAAAAPLEPEASQHLLDESSTTATRRRRLTAVSAGS